MESLRHALQEGLPTCLRAVQGTSAGPAWPGVLLWVIGRHASLASKAHGSLNHHDANTHVLLLPCRRLLEAGCRGDGAWSTHNQVPACGCTTGSLGVAAQPDSSDDVRQVSHQSAAAAPSSWQAVHGYQRPFQHRQHHLQIAYGHGLVQQRAYASKTKVEYVPLPGETNDPYTSMPTNPIQLLSALGTAGNLDRLEQLMQPDMLQRFEPVHIAAALARLPKVLRYRDKDMVETGVVAPQGSGVRALRPIPGASPKQSHTARGTALALTLCGLLPAAAPRLYPRQVANCIWALGTLRGMGLPVVEPQPGERRRQLSAAAGDRPPAQASALPSVEGATLDWLAGSMHLTMGSTFTDAYVALLGVLAKGGFAALHAHVQPVEVAQLLKGMAMLPRGCQHYPTVHALARWLARNVQAFGARELHMALRGLAQLRDARESPEGAEAVGAALIAAVPRITELHTEFSPIGIASLMWAYAYACPRVPGHLQLVDRTVVHGLFDILAEGLAPQIVQVNPQDIAMIMWACANQDYRNPDLTQLLGRKAVQLLESFQPGELAQTLLAMSDLRIAYPPLFAAVVRSVSREPEIDAGLGPEVVSRVTCAFASGGLEAVAVQAEAEAEAGNRAGSSGAAGGRGDAQTGPAEAVLAAKRQALTMLRRIRQPLTAGLKSGELRVTVEQIVRMAWALSAVRQQQAGLAVEAAAAARHRNGDGDDASAEQRLVAAQQAEKEEREDKELMQALADAAEALVPSCSLSQLAAVMIATEELELDAIMLTAATSNQARLLLRQLREDGVQLGRTAAAAAALRHAEDVLRVCDARGLNDPELAGAVAGLLQSLHARNAWGAESKPGPTRLLQLLVSCHRMNSAKPELRRVIGALLPSGDALAPGAVPPGLLAQAFVAYAEAVHDEQQRAAQQAAAGPAQAPGTAAGEGAGKEGLKADITAMEVLASALTKGTPQQLEATQQEALKVAVDRMLKLAAARDSPSSEQGMRALQAWLQG